MALWGGRFSEGPSAALAALSRSVEFDWRLATYDIEVNLTHLDSLLATGVITAGNGEVIRAGLKALQVEISNGTFTYNEEDEDVQLSWPRRVGQAIELFDS